MIWFVRGFSTCSQRKKNKCFILSSPKPELRRVPNLILKVNQNKIRE